MRACPGTLEDIRTMDAWVTILESLPSVAKYPGRGFIREPGTLGSPRDARKYPGGAKVSTLGSPLDARKYPGGAKVSTLERQKQVPWRS